MTPLHVEESANADEQKNCVIEPSSCEVEFRTSVITPSSSEAGEHEFSSFQVMSPKGLAEQLKEARRDAKQSAEALENLIKGIRAVKRILERDTLDNDNQSKDDDSNNTTMIADQDILSNLSTQLPGILGSDLLALTNVANMARDHAKLALQESSVLVSDIHQVTQENESLVKKSKLSEKVSRKLYKQNLKLKEDGGRLRGERRALIKEVKHLRQEKEETSKFDTWRLLEEHVLDRMSIHEMIMKMSTSSSNAQSNKSSSEIRTSGKKATLPLPRLGDSPLSCSESSMSYASSGDNETTDSDTDSNIDAYTDSDTSSEDDGIRDKSNKSMPTNVSLTTRRPPSPLVIPKLSPSVVGSTELKPNCDPNILRTLAIPSEESALDSKFKIPPARERLRQ
jgi:hypothetical protein